MGNVKKKGKGRKGKTGDLSMTEQLQALRDAQSVIGEESKAPLDFDWGDEDDDSDDSDSELSKQQEEEDKKHQLHSFKEVDEEEEEEDGAIFDLLSIDDVNIFKKHLDTRSVSIEKSFETLQQYVQKRSDTLKTEYNNNRYDADMGTPQLHKIVKEKIHKIMKKNGAISELHQYLDYVKEQAVLRRAIGPVILKKATTALTTMENNALALLKKSLGITDTKGTEQDLKTKTLEEQEEMLETSVGAVMQCGRMASSIQAEPLLKAGIAMMTQVDRCRELNKMLNKSLFGSPEALKSFSLVRTMPNVPLPLQNVLRAMFILIGTAPATVQDWNKTKKLCSPAGYNTLKKRIQETSPLLKNMTERVANALKIIDGHDQLNEIPMDWVAGMGCHTWVFGVMYACGVEDPRTLVEASNEKEDKVAVAAKAVGKDQASIVAGAAEFGIDNSDSSDSGESMSSYSDSEESEIDEEEAAFAAAGFATEEELKHLNGRVQVAATDEEKSNYEKKGRLISPADAKKDSSSSSSSSSSGSESSDDENDNESKTETLKKANGRKFGKIESRRKSSCEFNGFTTAPERWWNGEKSTKTTPKIENNSKMVLYYQMLIT